MEKIINQKGILQHRERFMPINQTTVLVGGCFDVLHPGHTAFLEEAKKQGDFLVVLLESDKSIRALKGQNRPQYPQNVRTEALAKLPAIDLIITLDGELSDQEYDELILAIKPAIIATTEGDEYIHHKRRQADLAHARLIPVIKRLPEFSTSKLLGE